MTATRAIQGERVPRYVADAYGLYFTEQSCVTRDLMTMILSDATTGKTFHEIGDTIAIRRTGITI